MDAQTPRWTALIGGFGFTALFALAAVLYGNGAGRGAVEIVAYYGSPANRLAQVEGFAALNVALVLFALFITSVHSMVARSEPWSAMIVATGTATLVCFLVANSLWASSAFTTIIEMGYSIDPRTHLLVEDAGFTFLVSAGVVGAGFVGATSIALLKDPRFPRWLGWLGVPAAAALLAVYWYVPLFAFFVWIAVVAVAGFTRRPA